MQNHISIFNFEKQTVRTASNEQGEPLFCLRDVANILNISNAQQSRFNLDEAGVHKMYISYPSGSKQVTFISEPNLYRLIFRSNKKEAIKFQNWVFDEVLPQIRQTGMYHNYSLLAQYNNAILEFDKISDLASQAGRMLNLAGKQFKPKAKQKVIELAERVQPLLPEFDGGVK
ncbi:BRO family protein [Moraxella bovoculi]|uniref:BRO family protein n=1 Tax=Moraxella bovoculi TaxID=386891 RepID=UPI0009BC6C51|nr:BRO family protein [Moraxella bovoculi]